MHPAHRTVGVVGFRSAMEGYRPVEECLTDDAETQPPEDDGGTPEIGDEDENLA
jgi:hypothetical protein